MIDSHYLCHRVFHTGTRNLDWQGKATGVTFGFLRSVLQIQNEFPHCQLVFCFEGASLRRRDIFPGYKIRQATDKTEEERLAYSSLGQQIEELRDKHLVRVGFRNVFSIRGYESDDLLARIARDEQANWREVILVTGDYDLFQCLDKKVSIYLPQKQRVLTVDWFWKTYGFRPSKWALVKALSGCSSDRVPGIPGVGEKTALKYCRGEIPENSPAWLNIMQGKEIVRRNRKLVQLPFDDCPQLRIRADSLNKQEWHAMTSGMGMRSLAGRPPL